MNTTGKCISEGGVRYSATRSVKRFLLLLVGALVLVCGHTGSLRAEAISMRLDFSESNILFHYTERTRLRSGKFEKFRGTVLFDADAVEKTTAEIIIDVRSLDMKSFLREGTLATRPWLNSKAYPTASFALSALRHKEDDEDPTRYTATGEIQIRGKVLQKRFSVNLVREENRFTASGVLRLSRKELDMHDALVEEIVPIGDNIWVSFVLVGYQKS